MPIFGWRELALLLVVLSALTALLGSNEPSTTPVDPTTASTKDAAAPRWDAATSPSIAATASREAIRMNEPTNSPPATASSPPMAPPAEEAYREWSIPPSPMPVLGGAAAKAVTSPAAPTVPAPSPAEKFWADCTGAGGLPSGGRIFFPLPKAHLNSYGDTWGAPRPQGGHEGADMMVPAGTPELAVTDGTLVAVAGSNANGWNSLGGYAVMLRADYSVGPIKVGDLLYYAHMNVKSRLPIGARVQAGQVLGYAGDTGQGPEVTRGLFPPHLHFGWYDAEGGAGSAFGARSAVPSGAIDPFPMLGWIKANGGAGGSDAGRCAAPNVGAPIPADAPPTAENRWPADGSPGLGPDLDTGSDNPNPAPAPRAQAEAPTQQNPREGDEPTRGAATPGQAAGTSEREPSAPATAVPSAAVGSPAPARPPGRPTTGPQIQTPRPLEPVNPEPSRDPRDPRDPRDANALQAGPVNPPQSSRPDPPAPGNVPPSRPGSPPPVDAGNEEPEGPTLDAPSVPDPEAWIPYPLPDGREDVPGRDEGRGAEEDGNGGAGNKGPAEATVAGMAETAG